MIFTVRKGRKKKLNFLCLIKTKTEMCAYLNEVVENSKN